MTSYQQRTILLYDEIISGDYYINILNEIAHEYGVNLREWILSDNVSDGEFCTFWNTFWEMLPDSHEIHRAPFNLICDMCSEYDYGDEDDTPAF